MHAIAIAGRLELLRRAKENLSVLPPDGDECMCIAVPGEYAVFG